MFLINFFFFFLKSFSTIRLYGSSIPVSPLSSQPSAKVQSLLPLHFSLRHLVCSSVPFLSCWTYLLRSPKVLAWWNRKATELGLQLLITEAEEQGDNKGWKKHFTAISNSKYDPTITSYIQLERLVCGHEEEMKQESGPSEIRTTLRSSCRQMEVKQSRALSLIRIKWSLGLFKGWFHRDWLSFGQRSS